MFWSFCYLVLRCVLQFVSLRPRCWQFKELEIVVPRVGARIRACCKSVRSSARPILCTPHGHAMRRRGRSHLEALPQWDR